MLGVGCLCGCLSDESVCVWYLCVCVHEEQLATNPAYLFQSVRVQCCKKKIYNWCRRPCKQGKAAILFCMSPTCVDAHYLYFGTRNKHTTASTLQEIRVRDYGVIRLLMPLLGGVVTTRERTSPLPTSPSCGSMQAVCVRFPWYCKI